MRSSHWRTFALPLALLGLGAALRSWNLGFASIWADEQDSLMQSRILGEIWPARGNGVLYFVLLHLWRLPFGESAIAIRSLSVVLGLIGIGAAGFLSYRIARSRQAGTITIAVAAFLPILVWHSRDARMYTLWGLGWMLALHAFVDLHQQKARRWTSFNYCVGHSIGILSHNFHFFYLLGSVAASFFLTSKNDAWKTRFAQVGKLHAPLAIVGLYLAVRMIRISGMATEYWQKYTFNDSRFGLIPSLTEVFLYKGPAGSQFGSYWIGTGIFLLLLSMSFAVWKNRHVETSLRNALLVFLWFPFVVIHVLPIRDYARLFYPFALISTVVVGVALTSWAPARLRFSWMPPALQGAAVCLLAFFLSAPLIQGMTVDMEPWKPFCRQLAQIGERRIVISEIGQMESPIRQCELISGKAIRYYPKSDSFGNLMVQLAAEQHFAVLRSPPWVLHDASLIDSFTAEHSRVSEYLLGPYLTITYIDRK